MLVSCSIIAASSAGYRGMFGREARNRRHFCHQLSLCQVRNQTAGRPKLETRNHFWPKEGTRQQQQSAGYGEIALPGTEAGALNER